MYPKPLCDAICKGIRKQMDCDKKGLFFIASIQVQNSKEAIKEKEELLNHISKSTVTEDFEADLAMAWDDVTGKELDATKVAQARKEEVDYIHKTNLYIKVPRSKAKQLGAKVISVQ